jgi:hypothetical protein
MADKILSKKPYGNHKMFSIENKFLAHVDTKRMNWYLDRDLGVMVNDKDFKLTFKSKGDKDRGEYYKLELQNCCVVCGVENDLTKHHVVPHQYRKYFPDEYKSKSSFDVLCVCKDCHNDYELEADVLKEDLLKAWGLTNYTKDVLRVTKSLYALENYAEYIDGERKERMIGHIEKFFNDSFDNILDDEEIDGNFEFEPATSIMIRKISERGNKELENFIVMWRKHFIQVAKPKFLPQEWYDEMNNVIKFYE